MTRDISQLEFQIKGLDINTPEGWQAIQQRWTRNLELLSTAGESVLSKITEIKNISKTQLDLLPPEDSSRAVYQQLYDDSAVQETQLKHQLESIRMYKGTVSDLDRITAATERVETTRQLFRETAEESVSLIADATHAILTAVLAPSKEEKPVADKGSANGVADEYKTHS